MSLKRMNYDAVTGTVICRPAGTGFRVVDAFSRIIRLGEGVSTFGRLSEAAIDRAIAALAICRNKMKNRGVTRACLIATEACHAAENGHEFSRPRRGGIGDRARGDRS